MAKRPTDLLETYSVAYRSGIADLPHHKTASILLNLTTQFLVLEPTMASRKFWLRLSIPYENIFDITLAPHETSTVEGILGGIGGTNTSRLSTDNNIDIRFVDAAGATHSLRVEMMTGLSVTGQAAIAQQLQNRLDLHGLRARFAAPAVTSAPAAAPTAPLDAKPDASPRAPIAPAAATSPDEIVALIGQLAQLNTAGALTDAEFAAKKAELLARL
jgi:hypothetical protein